jgi:hypothetical protein
VAEDLEVIDVKAYVIVKKLKELFNQSVVLFYVEVTVAVIHFDKRLEVIGIDVLELYVLAECTELFRD